VPAGTGRGIFGENVGAEGVNKRYRLPKLTNMGDVGKMGKGKSSFIGKLLVNYDATVRTLCVTFVTIFSGAL